MSRPLAGLSGLWTLGAKRQVFLVSLDGFDTHEDQLDHLGPSLASVSKAVNYFYNGTALLHKSPATQHAADRLAG